MKKQLQKVLSAWPHLLRAFAMSLAALSAVWGITRTSGLVAAMLGAAFGVWAGHALGKSRLRLAVALGATTIGTLFVVKLCSLARATEFVPSLLGPPGTLKITGFLQFLVVPFALTTIMRTLATRYAAMTALELLAVAASVPTAFASHRDGVLVRPLWLSDWAYWHGIDPGTILLVVGGIAVLILAILLVAQTRSGRSLSAILALLALSGFAVIMIQANPLPPPLPLSELGLTQSNNNPPPPPDGGPSNDGGQSDAASDGGGRGDSGDGASSGDGGDGSSAGLQDVNWVEVGGSGDGSSDGGAAEASDPNPDPDQPNQRPTPVAFVRFENDYSPPMHGFYFRQEAWSQFNGVRLEHTTRNDVDLDIMDTFPTERAEVRDQVPSGPQLADGVHVIHVRTESGSADSSFTIDSTTRVRITEPTEGMALSQRAVTVRGGALPNAIVRVSIDGRPTDVTADSGGSWSLPPNGLLTPGSHNITAITAGVQSVVNFTVNADGFPIAIISPDQNATIDNASPTITGLIGPGFTVRVFLDNGSANNATVDTNGRWTYTPSNPLGDGQHTIYVVATDASMQTASANSSFRVNTMAPGATVPLEITVPANRATTAGRSPPISGRAPPNTVVHVRVDNDAEQEATADGEGHWTLSASGRTRVSGSVSLLVPHTRPFGLEGAIAYAPRRNPAPQRFVRSYRFESLALNIPYGRMIGRQAGDSRWTPEVREYYLRAPTDPRYRTLLDEILRDAHLNPRYANDPMAKALVVQRWLNHALTYSTRERHAGTTDPTADCLFGNRTGYCVHFSHGAVFLWRLLGIPARVAVGYYVDESERGSSSRLVIRGKDAHAWPELYLDGLGWVVLDIAAERVIDQPGPPPDPDVTEMLDDLDNEEPDPNNPERRRPPQVQVGKYVRWGSYLGILGAILALFAVKIWWRISPRFAASKTLPRVGYRAVLEELAALGISREYGESREAFAKRLKKRVPSLEKLTDLHVQAKFGNPNSKDKPESLDRAVWLKGADDVRREVRKDVSWWRKALAYLNPASMFDAR